MGATFHKVTARRENYSKFFKDLNQLFLDNHYDVVWLNVVSLSQISLLRIAKKHDVKRRIVHIHNNYHIGSILSMGLHIISKRLVTFHSTDFWGSYQSALE